MNKDTINKVYEVINNSRIPIDPYNIAKAIDVGWGTALKYAMDLVIQGRIKGIKTTKGWVFWGGQNNE